MYQMIQVCPAFVLVTSCMSCRTPTVSLGVQDISYLNQLLSAVVEGFWVNYKILELIHGTQRSKYQPLISI